MVDLDAFSKVVLDLQSLAYASSADGFQVAALDRLQQVLPFDSAWWGIMSPAEDAFRLHCSLPYQLPDSYVPMWEHLKREDAVAQAVRDQPRSTAYFDLQGLAVRPGLLELTAEHGIGQVLCTSLYLASERAFIFLSLYRSFTAPPFEVDHRSLNQYLMPHMCAAWEASRMFQIEYLKANSTHSHTALALVDGGCEILNAESEFFDVLQQEFAEAERNWPHDRLRDWMSGTEESLKLSSIVLRRHRVGDLWLVAARGKTRIDLLTRRELQIAEDVGRGRSYKEIARLVSIAPATVRHHIRTIYAKLGIGDKAELSTLLAGRDEFLDSERLVQRSRALS